MKIEQIDRRVDDLGTDSQVHVKYRLRFLDGKNDPIENKQVQVFEGEKLIFDADTNAEGVAGIEVLADIRKETKRRVTFVLGGKQKMDHVFSFESEVKQREDGLLARERAQKEVCKNRISEGKPRIVNSKFEVSALVTFDQYLDGLRRANEITVAEYEKLKSLTRSYASAVKGARALHPAGKVPTLEHVEFELTQLCVAELKDICNNMQKPVLVIEPARSFQENLEAMRAPVSFTNRNGKAKRRAVMRVISLDGKIPPRTAKVTVHVADGANKNMAADRVMPAVEGPNKFADIFMGIRNKETPAPAPASGDAKRFPELFMELRPKEIPATTKIKTAGEIPFSKIFMDLGRKGVPAPSNIRTQEKRSVSDIKIGAFQSLLFSSIIEAKEQGNYENVIGNYYQDPSAASRQFTILDPGWASKDVYFANVLVRHGECAVSFAAGGDAAGKHRRASMKLFEFTPGDSVPR